VFTRGEATLMIVPPTPLQEHARLASLYAYDILDTPAEPSFDALTRLAARVSDAPVSLITLIDARRQWFKSCHGLALTETGRDVSFCGHVVADERPLVVPDTLNDERFHDNPFVTSAPFVRFYAGAPLCAPSGHVLGTICVVDYVPRELTREQQELLELLAQQALALLELRRSERAAHSRRLALETLDKQVREAAASAEGGLASSDDAPASARSTHSLAAGIGHEINNPLTYVLANVGLALEHVRTLAPEHARPLEELLVDVRSGAERIRAIVQGLQALGRDARPPARVAVRLPTRCRCCGWTSRGRRRRWPTSWSTRRRPSAPPTPRSTTCGSRRRSRRRGALRCRCATTARASRRTRRRGCSSPSIAPRRAASGWGCRSRTASSRAPAAP
jgi:hypothetical protein